MHFTLSGHGRAGVISGGHVNPYAASLILGRARMERMCEVKCAELVEGSAANAALDEK